jgi:hypothetical protein
MESGIIAFDPESGKVNATIDLGKPEFATADAASHCAFV